MTTIPVIATETVKLYRRPLQGGAQRLTIESPTLTAVHPTGRRSVDFTPASAGSHTVTVRGGSSSASATIEAVATPSPWPTFNALFLGDSNTLGSQVHVFKGFVGRFKDDVGANVTLLGTQSTTWDSTTYDHGGYSGYAWEDFDSDAGPLKASGVYNIPSYETTLGAVPDVIFFCLGTNDTTDSISAARSVSQHTAKMKGHIDNVVAGITGTWGSVDIVICTTLPGAFFQTSQVREYVYAGNRMVLANYADGQVDQVSVLPVHLCVDPHTGYPSTDSLHPDNDVHQAIADMHRWWCAANVS